MIPSNFRNFLIAQGAAKTAHSGYTLLDHLSGVHRILVASGSADYVCTAGLFHSVYGTESFKTVTIDASRRAEVHDFIGQKSEHLVWTFCNLPRPKLFEVSLQKNVFDWVDQVVSQNGNKNQLWEDLVRLECANLLEQKSLYEFPFLAHHAQEIGMLSGDGFSV